MAILVMVRITRHFMQGLYIQNGCCVPLLKKIRITFIYPEQFWFFVTH